MKESQPHSTREFVGRVAAAAAAAGIGAAAAPRVLGAEEITEMRAATAPGHDRGTGAAAVRNVFATAPEGGILAAEARIEIPGDSSMTALQALGARFIVCNNALNFWVARIAAAVNRPAADIRSELEANMLPRITIVPAMVIAMNQAQGEGASYMYLA